MKIQNTYEVQSIRKQHWFEAAECFCVVLKSRKTIKTENLACTTWNENG